MQTIAIAVGLILLVALGGFLYVRTNITTQPEQTAQDQTPASPTTATIPESTESAIQNNTLMQESTKQVVVRGSNFSFDKKEIRVKKGDTVKVTFQSAAGMHNFVLPDFDVKTAVLQTGGEETATFTADTTGSFEYFCSVGKHREMGMKGMLIVE